MQPESLTAAHSQITDFLALALRDQPASWRSLQPSVSSAEFLAACRHHGVQGLLFHQLSATGAGTDWPAEVHAALQRECAESVATDLLRTHHLRVMGNLFRDRRIRSILMKGEALARTHYPDPGTRPRGDTDLFIPLSDIETARGTLVDQGFRVVSSTYRSRQFTVRPPGDGGVAVAFDVHWRIQNSPLYARSVDFEEAFAASRPLAELPGIHVLSPVHALLLACMHRAGNLQHDANRLIWLYDIHRLFSALDDAERDRFFRLVASRELQACCRDGLELAARRFGTPVPPLRLTGLANSTGRESLRTRFRKSHLGLLVDDWRSLTGWRQRRHLLGELFVPSSDSLMQRFGKQDRRWLPLLYVRQISRGITHRLMLR